MIGLGIFAIFLHFLFLERHSNHTSRNNSPSTSYSGYLKTILGTVLCSFLFLGIAVFMIAFIGGDTVASRIETIHSEAVENETTKLHRREIWQATWQVIKETPIAGVGFGAYPAAITKHDTLSGRLSLQEAHNDYLEVLAGGGIIAFLLMLSFYGILFKEIYRQLKSGDPLRRASCLGAATGIFGVMLHSLVDFGLHIFVNALVFIVLVVLATAEIKKNKL
jgi:O-antigen ligase